MSAPLTRRRLLQGLTALGLLPLVGCGTKPSAVEPLLRTLLQEIPLPDPATVGQAVLRALPEENNLPHLVETTLASLPLEDSLQAIGQAFGGQLREDFAAGNTLVADGWLVSQTEARFCALLFLSRANQAAK